MILPNDTCPRNAIDAVAGLVGFDPSLAVGAPGGAC
jgi:hypothetical protein